MSDREVCDHNNTWFDRTICLRDDGTERMATLCSDCGIDLDAKTAPKREGMRPCPFCGSDNIQFNHAPETWMNCCSCGAEGPMATDGRSKWNDAYCWKEIDRLKAAMKDMVYANSDERSLKSEVVRLRAALETIASSAPCKEGHESFNTPGQPCDQRIASEALRSEGGEGK